MDKVVPMHYIMMAVGEHLKLNAKVTPHDVQDVLAKDINTGVRPSLNECRCALDLLVIAGFIESVPDEKECFKRILKEGGIQN